MSFDISTYNTKAISKESKSGSVLKKLKLSDKNKEMLYREFAMLLRSGVDFKKSLEIMIDMSKNKVEKQIILSIKLDVIEGKSICEAMMAAGCFSPYEYYSVQIGEETSRLEQVLTELQKFFNRKIQMKRQIISVLTYPAIVLIVTFLVLYFMLTKVVPMFQSVFRQFNSELPKSTQYILMLSNNAGLIFGSIAFLIISLIAFHYIFKTKNEYRSATSRAILKIPYFGNLVRKIYLSRFCQSMSLLTSSKTPLINSLSLTAKMIGFYPLENSIEQIKMDVMRGGTLCESFKKHKVYEEKMVSMVEVAEQVNQLDIMFERLAEQYNEEISHQTKMIGVVLEPMIIIIIGLVVGTIMISMYAPMFDLSKIIK
jgi:type IV pilus assembly protein PilC